MFNTLFSEETGHTNPDKDEGGASTSRGDANTSGAPNTLLNFWSVATAVTNTVKARADELVKSVVDTDWRSELSQFSKEVGEESKTLKEKTAEVVQHLPEQVVHLPEKAEEALQHLPAPVHLPKDVGQTLEGVGVAFAHFGKSLLLGTKELIDELKEGVETEIAAASREGKRAGRSKASATTASKMATVQAKYNRFEAEVAAMQRDSSTYCDEPEDAEEYARWKAGFSLDAVKGDISRIVAENAFMAELQSRLVPIIVEHDDFWRRYFYRLHKLQQKEEQRQLLAQRAKTLQEDEVPLGWGDEDEAAPAASASEQQLAAPLVPPAASETLAPAPPEPTSEPSAVALVPLGTDAAPEAPRIAEQPSPKAAAVPARESKATAVAPAPEAAAEASPSQPAQEALTPGSKAQSAGGASEPGSASANLDVDSSQMESEPHAETASDSSTKEWCVVTSNHGQNTSSGGAPPTALPTVPAERAEPVEFEATPSEEVASIVESDAVERVPAAGAPSDEAKPGVTGDPAPAAKASSTPPAALQAAVPAVRTAAAATAAAVPAVSSGAKAPAKAGDEEDVDEDWGNWD